MRIALIIIIVIHAFIHLIGFVKAFGFFEIKQLRLSLSKSQGLLWLLAFILLLLTVVLFVFGTQYWWLLAIAACLLSQTLIVRSWKEAKFGTVLNGVFLIALIIGFATHRYYHTYKDDVTTAMRQTAYVYDSLLTEADLYRLPEPVKKYLRYTACIGKPKVNNFRIDFVGKIRKNEDSEWMPFSSEQYNFMKIPTRLFFMKAQMKGLPVAGYHSFNNGVAFMDIRLVSLVKVQFQEGPEMNMAETVTFFNDMCCMAPATLIDTRITWQQEEGNKVQATFSNNGISIHAWLYFNEKGELVNFISHDRYAADAGRQLPWATPLKNYKEMNGYMLASEAQTIYSYPDRDLCYGTFQMVNVTYNVNE